MLVLYWIVFGWDCMVLLVGRGNLGLEKCIGPGATFWDTDSQNFFLEAPPPVLRLMFTIPNNRCQKS